ncbi:hypothetical protein JCM5353_004630 [Sporobolomyces roseus]
MKGSKSFTISTLSPQYRSGEGRRMPYHMLQRGQHIDDDALLNSETETREFLSDYEKPGKPLLQGLEEWDKAHRRLMDWFYSPDAPCLVDPASPNQHTVEFLCETATASRVRGHQVVLYKAQALATQFRSRDFASAILEWGRLSTEGRKEFVLKTLGEKARETESGGVDNFSKNRKLIPEITVAELCANEGAGLLRFFDLICQNVSNPALLASRPIYNGKFFNKFGIPTSKDSLPLSKADRAMQEEFVLVRHSHLLDFAQRLWLGLIGKPPPRSRMVGNFASDFTAQGQVPLAPSFISTQGRYPSSAGVAKLLFCSKCRTVGRNQPYCSAPCQKKDWKSHKTSGRCGTKLSDLQPVPIIMNEESSSTSQLPSHPLRFALLDCLNLNAGKNYVWAIRQSDSTWIGLRRADLTESNTVEAVRSLVFRALRTSAKDAIDLLAPLVNVAFNVNLERFAIEDTAANLELAVATQFREMFFLSNNDEWSAARLRGEHAMEEPKNQLVKQWFDSTEDQAREGLLNGLNLPDPSNPLYPIIRGVFETALGSTKNRSAVDIAADMFGVTDPSVKKELGEFIKQRKAEERRKTTEETKDERGFENVELFERREDGTK